MRSIQWIGPHPLTIARVIVHQFMRRLRQRRLRATYAAVVANAPTGDMRGMAVDLGATDRLPAGLRAAAADIRREADMACNHIVDLLGSGPTSVGDPIDWHKDYKRGYRWPNLFYQDVEATRLDDDSDAKAPWELSRGHQLVALARAAVLFGDERYATELEAQLWSWMRQNPPGVGINWQNAMEVALRAVSWVWAVGTLERWRPLAPSLRFEVARSLGAHGRHIERNLEGTPWVRSNHYMADLLGLLVLGWALPDDPRSRRWWHMARRGFEREILRQVHDDGVGFEASLSYHGLVLEMLIIAAWIARQASEPFSSGFYGRLQAMVDASRALRHPNGRAPQIGDSDSGRVLPATSARPATHDHLIWLGAAVLGREKPLPGEPSCEVAWTLGLPCWKTLAGSPPARPPARRGFPAAGYWVLADEAAHLVVRAGDVGQNGNGGHAHNDALSFELSLGGSPLIVDPGTYLDTADPAARNAFRSTDAHNTLRVDGEEINPLEPEHLFRLRQVARIRVEEATDRSVTVSHDGYCRLTSPVLHRRSFTITEAQGVEIIDEVQGTGEHLFEWFMHLAPATRIARLMAGRFLLVLGAISTEVICAPQAGLSVTIRDGWVSEQFGVREHAPVLVARTRAPAPTKLRWTISTSERLRTGQSVLPCEPRSRQTFRPTL